MSHKPLKVTAAKSFPSVSTIDTTCFNECFLFHVITGRHYFLHKFGTTVMLLRSLKQMTNVLKEVGILYPLSPQ